MEHRVEPPDAFDRVFGRLIAVKVLLVTDAWEPQTNGVVTTLRHTIAGMAAMGHDVEVLSPNGFRTIGLPSYPEIRIAVNLQSVGRRILDARADAVHIATEGPLGVAARAFLVRHGVRFTTSLHTKFPEYVHTRTRAPLAWGYAVLRWFHAPAAATLVTTEGQRRELQAWGLRHLVVWGRGVDTEKFVPRPEPEKRAEPLLLYVGRIAVEKNVEAFLALDVPGRKVVVGDGPQRAELEGRYPAAEFVGYQYGPDLARWYADADVFVFPSRTDTFGLVMLEAMASGTPVAGFPVTGPKDVVLDGQTGALDDDLGLAVQRALRCDRGACRDFALANSWAAVAERFRDVLVPWRADLARLPAD